MSKKYLLNVGLAFTLLYAGISSFLYTSDWVGFVPEFVEKFGMTREIALHMHAVLEILLGALLLTNWKVKLVALVAALDMAAILLVNGFGRGIFLITFRDVGLLFMAIYLAVTNDEIR